MSFEYFVKTQLSRNTYWKAKSFSLTIYFNDLVALNDALSLLENCGCELLGAYRLERNLTRGRYIAHIQLPHGVKTTALRNKLKRVAA